MRVYSRVLPGDIILLSGVPPVPKKSEASCRPQREPGSLKRPLSVSTVSQYAHFVPEKGQCLPLTRGKRPVKAAVMAVGSAMVQVLFVFE